MVRAGGSTEILIGTSRQDRDQGSGLPSKLPSKLRASGVNSVNTSGSVQANTGKNSTEVQCGSITLCVSFERAGKALNGGELDKFRMARRETGIGIWRSWEMSKWSERDDRGKVKSPALQNRFVPYVTVVPEVAGTPVEPTL